MDIIAAVLRKRPFLWLLGLVVLAVLVSTTWEKSTSYNDGGLGTASFLILVTLGWPFLWPGQLFAQPLMAHGVTWAWLYWGMGFLSLVLFYVGLDQLSLAWLRRRERRGSTPL